MCICLCFFSCAERTSEQSASAGKKSSPVIGNGFYEVLYIDSIGAVNSEKPGRAVLSLDTIFNKEDHRKVIVDLSDYVPLELEGLPKAEQQTDRKKLLSITLTESAAEKMKTFTAKRVMKQVAIVLDGEVITMHKIREAITGPGMQITRCDDNACEYLFVKMKGQ